MSARTVAERQEISESPRTAPAWKDCPARFARRAGETWLQAVERDADELLERYRELPTISRYSAAIDPRREPEAACGAVCAAFDAAHAWTDALARAWRERHPAWREAIDAAVAIHSLQDLPEAFYGIGARIGPAAADGLGRYELLERVGQGSSGLVFRAIDRVFDAGGEPSEVAIKLVPCLDSDVGSGLREAANARRVSHGGVARVLDAGRLDAELASRLGRDDLGLFIVQEFIHGQPLWIWKACHPEGAAERGRAIIADVREALVACHALGVVHGDLHPANIMVEADGRARLIDFGRSNRSGRPDDAAARDRDLARLSAIEAWLLRDARDVARRSVRRRFAVASLTVMAGGIALVSFRPALTRVGSATASPPDLRVDGYELFRREGRVILIPGGNARAGEAVDIKGSETVESLVMLDPSMVTFKIQEEDFESMFGTATEPPGGKGPAVIRMSKEELAKRLGGFGSGRVVGLPGRPAGEEAGARPGVQDETITRLFGDSVFKTGHEEQLTLARALLGEGPPPASAVDSWLAITKRIMSDADASRAGGQADSGRDLLAALAFLAMNANSEALRLALQATTPNMSAERRELAAIIESIAAWRLGTGFGGVGKAEVEEFARRHAAPGLTRIPFRP